MKQLLKEQTVFTMAALRIISGIIEVCAAVLILRLNRVDTALRINGILAVVGPTILLLGIAVGVAGVYDRIPLGRLILIYLGAGLIFIGTRQL